MSAGELSRRAFIASLLSAPWTSALAQQQVLDSNFRPQVSQPAFTRRRRRPRLLIDEAHRNFHRLDGRYQPFAALMRADGWNVARGESPFTLSGLVDVDVLVVANAGSANGADTTEAAFTHEECMVAKEWVEEGGALLLIADHAPFGAAAAPLGELFNFRMGNGWVYKPTTSGSLTTQLIFDLEHTTLRRHPTTTGPQLRQRRFSVKTFTGQSLVPPPQATPLLILDDSCREAASRSALDAAAAALAQGFTPEDPSVGGRCQAFALMHGRGRVVVLGEAGMLSAQRVTLPNEDGSERELLVGMNVPGFNNQEFALNMMRWLERAG